MPQKDETPKVRPGGLVTVAFLKAQLDERNDHLGIFMPLVVDALSQLPNQSFITDNVQEVIAARHGVAMPRQTVATLLKRAKKYLIREGGRYKRGNQALPSLNVLAEKGEIEKGQRRLAEALCKHSARRGLVVESDTALEMLFAFLEEEQVGMLLGSPVDTSQKPEVSERERAIVAEFIQTVAKDDPALQSVLRGMLEGLVLYHAAFLPDLAAASRRFKALRVVFDSVLVRQALGYEGAAMLALARETIDVLKASDVQCLVFDKTVEEIQRILTLYEARLATSQGRNSLRPVPMARHFLTQRYSPSDVREMSALLEREIHLAGFQIARVPARVKDYTAGEKALAARLADPGKKDELEPRVVHDVDCVAAILTLRKGHRSSSIDNARIVFATTSPLVIRNTRLWWNEDENETGIEPVIHIRALSNLAWLKKPSLASDFKMRELVALCSAALRPTQTTWDRFLRHLQSLQKSDKLTSDEVTAILVSAMSDRLLRDAEIEEDDPEDIDVSTLDEVVDRVKSAYGAEADQRVREVTDQYETKVSSLEERAREAVARADTAERTAAAELRRQNLAIEGRCRRIARALTQVLHWSVRAIVAAGAVALIVGHPFHSGWIGWLIATPVVIFVALELLGILGHVSGWFAEVEARLTRQFRVWLSGELSSADDVTSAR